MEKKVRNDFDIVHVLKICSGKSHSFIFILYQEELEV